MDGPEIACYYVVPWPGWYSGAAKEKLTGWHVILDIPDFASQQNL